MTTHRVLATADPNLVIEDKQAMVTVEDEISEGQGGPRPGPGDLVEVVWQQEDGFAVELVKRKDPRLEKAQVEVSGEERLLVRMEAGDARLIPVPKEEEIQKGDIVLVTRLGEFYASSEDALGQEPGGEVSAGGSAEDREGIAERLFHGSLPGAITPEQLPDKGYEDFAGPEELVEEVRLKVELPLREPERFESVGMEAPKGLLFYGPPGTGKTYLAKIVASEVDEASFYSIRGPELSHELRGGTERKLRRLFQQAQVDEPAIIFFDEIDAVAPRRETVRDSGGKTVGQLLSLMDGLEERGNVVVIGATNRLGAIDPALRRPGRFGREIEFPMPSREDRVKIVEIHRPVDIPFGPGVSAEMIADETAGWSGARLASLFDEIGEILLREGRDGSPEARIRRIDVKRAIQRVQEQRTRKQAESRHRHSRQREEEGRRGRS